MQNNASRKQSFWLTSELWQMSKIPSFDWHTATVLERTLEKKLLGPKYSFGSITFWLFGLGQATTSGLVFSSAKMPALKISVASDDINCFEELWELWRFIPMYVRIDSCSNNSFYLSYSVNVYTTPLANNREQRRYILLCLLSGRHGTRTLYWNFIFVYYVILEQLYDVYILLTLYYRCCKSSLR